MKRENKKSSVGFGKRLAQVIVLTLSMALVVPVVPETTFGTGLAGAGMVTPPTPTPTPAATGVRARAADAMRTAGGWLSSAWSTAGGRVGNGLRSIRTAVGTVLRPWRWPGAVATGARAAGTGLVAVGTKAGIAGGGVAAGAAGAGYVAGAALAIGGTGAAVVTHLADDRAAERNNEEIAAGANAAVQQYQNGALYTYADELTLDRRVDESMRVLGQLRDSWAAFGESPVYDDHGAGDHVNTLTNLFKVDQNDPNKFVLREENFPAVTQAATELIAVMEHIYTEDREELFENETIKMARRISRNPINPQTGQSMLGPELASALAAVDNLMTKLEADRAAGNNGNRGPASVAVSLADPEGWTAIQDYMQNYCGKYKNPADLRKAYNDVRRHPEVINAQKLEDIEREASLIYWEEAEVGMHRAEALRNSPNLFKALKRSMMLKLAAVLHLDINNDGEALDAVGRMADRMLTDKNFDFQEHLAMMVEQRKGIQVNSRNLDPVVMSAMNSGFLSSSRDPEKANYYNTKLSGSIDSTENPYAELALNDSSPGSSHLPFEMILAVGDPEGGIGGNASAGLFHQKYNARDCMGKDSWYELDGLKKRLFGTSGVQNFCSIDAELSQGMYSMFFEGEVDRAKAQRLFRGIHNPNTMISVGRVEVDHRTGDIKERQETVKASDVYDEINRVIDWIHNPHHESVRIDREIWGASDTGFRDNYYGHRSTHRERLQTLLQSREAEAISQGIDPESGFRWDQLRALYTDEALAGGTGSVVLDAKVLQGLEEEFLPASIQRMAGGKRSLMELVYGRGGAMSDKWHEMEDIRACTAALAGGGRELATLSKRVLDEPSRVTKEEIHSVGRAMRAGVVLEQSADERDMEALFGRPSR